ncbi:MAG: methyltransferase domain-containing protein [Nitrospirae bacterium]|nr:methyltransferase domain-containing protein [Nitrospirota bacterium]
MAIQTDAQYENGCPKTPVVEDSREPVSPGLNARNFRKIAPSGFGDPYNCYPHSMAWFQGHVYVGTTRANLANRAKQVARTAPERLGEIWPVRVPNNYFDNDLRAEIWRYYPPLDTWEKVYVSPMARGIDGYDVPISIGFRCMTVFQGPNDSAPALYAPTWATHQTPAAYMLRSVDGVHFEIVSEPGLGLPDPKPRGLRGLVSFKGRLFTSPVVGQARLEPNIAGHMAVYVSSDPARGDWRLAFDPRWGGNNLSVFHMATFNGYLYIGTLNVNEGFQVWKTDAEGEPPFRWEKVLERGAYRGKLNQIAMTLIPFKGHLYVGSAIQNCSFDFSNKVGPAPSEIIRIGPDDRWDIVIGDPRLTPEGLKVPLSGLGPGCGNPFSGYIWAMCEHEGWLYIATAVWAVFLRYAGRQDHLPKSLRSFFTPENIERMLVRFGGSDLWRTRDGFHWIPVTQNGFDNCFNIGFRNMVSSPYGLFVGAANPFSPDVAVKRVAGWTYEKNQRGGLEIWMGSHPHAGQNGDGNALCRNGEPDAEEPVEHFLERAVSAFYGDSGFRHFGFWRFGINDAKTACENLMREILAFIPEKRGSIADIGCDSGATTRFLADHFPDDSVAGITNDAKALDACRQKAPQAAFHYSKLPKLALPSESFDYVVWVDGEHPLGSRKKLLQESFRVLKPGGRLVCFDTIRRERKEDGSAVKGLSRDAVKTPDEYRSLLEGTGFREPKLADVTDPCYGEFRKQARKYFDRERLAGRLDYELVQKIEARLLREREPVHLCMLITASKPAIGRDSSPEAKADKGEET